MLLHLATHWKMLFKMPHSITEECIKQGHWVLRQTYHKSSYSDLQPCQPTVHCRNQWQYSFPSPECRLSWPKLAWYIPRWCTGQWVLLLSINWIWCKVTLLMGATLLYLDITAELNCGPYARFNICNDQNIIIIITPHDITNNFSMTVGTFQDYSRSHSLFVWIECYNVLQDVTYEGHRSLHEHYLIIFLQQVVCLALCWSSSTLLSSNLSWY